MKSSGLHYVIELFSDHSIRVRYGRVAYSNKPESENNQAKQPHLSSIGSNIKIFSIRLQSRLCSTFLQ
jgi:hypothetical protein